MFSVEVSASLDDTDVRGNAMASGDAVADRACEDEIIARVNDGDIWAWASVRVSVRYIHDGVFYTEDDYLGCCSYADERDFVTSDGYFEDMVNDCVLGILEHVADKGTTVHADADLGRQVARHYRARKYGVK
jgi:hypothetical protein